MRAILLVTCIGLSACASKGSADFSFDRGECPGSSKEWKASELRELAVAEGNKRGLKLDPSKLKFAITQRGCKLLVIASDLPARPGGHFNVFVSADSGQIEFVPGL